MLNELINRFWDKVDVTDSCWLWTAHKNGYGYGTFRYNNKTGLAHRFSYELFEGNIINNLQLDHLCRVRHCVNPAHLQMVTLQENIKRGNTGHHTNQLRGKDHPSSKKTHCPQGHEYDEKNTYMDNRNTRNCRICISERGRKQYRRKIGR